MLLPWEVGWTRWSSRSFQSGIPWFLKPLLHIHKLHKAGGGSWCQPALWVNYGRDIYHRGILQNVLCRTPCNPVQPKWAGLRVLFCFSFIFLSAIDGKLSILPPEEEICLSVTTIWPQSLPHAVLNFIPSRGCDMELSCGDYCWGNCICHRCIKSSPVVPGKAGLIPISFSNKGG